MSTPIEPQAQQQAEGQQAEISQELVTSYITSNPDYLNNLLSTDIGQKALQPKLDQHFSKSLETWKANNLDKIVNERVEALFPNETPQAKQMRELQAQIDKINAEKAKAEMATITLNLLANEGVPNISDFKHEFNLALNGSVDSKFKQFSHQPQSNQPTQEPTVDISKMSYSERMALYNSNPNEYNRLFG